MVEIRAIPAPSRSYDRIMSAKATELMSIRDLLQTYCDVMEEFRKREILRSSNNPVADFSELLFCTAFGWNREGASAAGFDAICSRGLRYQIKGRRLTLNNPSRQLSFIRKLPEHQFDFLAGVLFHSGFLIKCAALVPHSVVEERARYSKHANAWLFDLKDEVWHEPGVDDVTEYLLSTFQYIDSLSQLHHQIDANR